MTRVSGADDDRKRPSSAYRWCEKIDDYSCLWLIALRSNMRNNSDGCE